MLPKSRLFWLPFCCKQQSIPDIRFMVPVGWISGRFYYTVQVPDPAEMFNDTR